MGKFLGAAMAGVLAFGCASALAAPPTRVRGDITAVHGNALHITTYGGHAVDLTLGHKTHYVLVVPASLSDIRSNDFVGIGATGPEDHLVALEVVIFPKSMRGTGEGHYAWSLPASVAAADRQHGVAASSAGAPPVQGSMTNGTVVGAAAADTPVQGSMTNGTVAGSSNGTGGRELTVGYEGGKQVQIMVPTSAPVVRLQPAHRSVVKPGAKAFAVASGANGKLNANIVAVGKDGLMPPM